MAWLTRSYGNSTGAPCFPGPRETADARVPVGGSSQVFHLHTVFYIPFAVFCGVLGPKSKTQRVSASTPAQPTSLWSVPDA